MKKDWRAGRPQVSQDMTERGAEILETSRGLQKTTALRF